MRTPGRYSVGRNLLLIVHKGRTRSWIARLTGPTKKLHDISLGKHPEVSLADARDEVGTLRKQIREGRDPIAAKRKALPTNCTFREAALARHNERACDFRNKKHVSQRINTLRDYAFGKIGDTRIDELKIPDVVYVIKPIWRDKRETAERVLQRIVAISVWAVLIGYR